jgi:hypothetical protein
MAGKDIIMASQGELKRLHVVHKVLEGSVRQTEAAGMLSLSTRQTRRIARRVREEGPQGVVHRLRGKASNRKLPRELKDRVLGFYFRKYEGFGPTLAQEKLLQLDGICISDENLRCWLMEGGSGRRSANAGSIGSGGSGRTGWERWCRWTVATMSGSKTEDRPVC